MRMRSRRSPQPTRSCPSTTAGADRDWRRNSGSLENSGKDLSRSLASLRSVKRIACVEPLAIQRHSDARTFYRHSRSDVLPIDRDRPPPPRSVKHAYYHWLLQPGASHSAAFWQHAENDRGAPAAERVTNQERRRIERSEVIPGEEVSVASQVGNRKQANQVMGTGKPNRHAAQAPPLRSERETRRWLAYDCAER